MIAGLLLAAGASRRFGTNKLLERLGDHPVVRWPAEVLADEVDELLVVVAGDTAEMRDALAGIPVRFVVNREPDAGLSSSIRAGVAALPADTEAVVIALGDQPLLARDAVTRVIARWREGDASAVAASYSDGRGHPVVFGAELFPALRTLEGDRGARVLLDGLADGLKTVAMDGVQPIDVDTRDALAEVSALVERRANEMP